jgi:sugar lactone lactonase YvrE
MRLTGGGMAHVLAHGIAAAGDTALAVPPGMGDDERLNDGSVHPSGRAFVVGSRHVDEREATGHVWVFSGTWQTLPWRFHCFNGGAFTPDGRSLYFTDSPTGVIWRAPVDPATFAIGDREVFARVPAPDGQPDGMAFDDSGCLWSAHWDGSRLTRWTPDGLVDRVIRLPASRITSLAFFGKTRNRLFVTSAMPDGASLETMPAQDPAGFCFTVDPGVTGPATPRLDDGVATALLRSSSHA